MSNTIKPVTQTRTSMAFTGLATLASANFVRSTNPYDLSANDPWDFIIELSATPSGATSGNQQLIVYAQETLDGTNYRSGPSSGTTTTDEPDLLFVGAMKMFSTNAHLATFSLGAALSYIPLKAYIVIKNDAGVGLSAGAVNTSEVWLTIV